MRQWVVQQLGDPKDALKLIESERPDSQVGEVLIEVAAAALNYFDILQCQGKYQEKHELPFTIGAEVAGMVVEAGENSGFRAGDRVAGLPQLPRGGLSELVAVHQDSVFHIPDSLSYAKAASMMITYHTAYYALHTCANLKEGEVLLVHAGAGGVGSAAIQLGKAAGATVIATAGGPEKVDICTRLGADLAIDYLSEDFVELVKKYTNGTGADVIFDPVGGDIFDRSRKAVAFAGRILAIGFAGGTISQAPVNHLLIKNYSIIGIHWGLFARLFPEKVKEEHGKLMELYEKRLIQPLIQKEYSFTEAPEALTALSNRKSWGKLVVLS